MKNVLIVSIIVLVFTLSLTTISGMLLSKKVAKSTIVYGKDKADLMINEDDEVVEVESRIEENNDNDNKENEIMNESNKKDEKIEEKNISKDINLCMLGEIMMGGSVSTNLSYLYTSAFKNVYNITKKSDFTYANLSTNITNLEKIENPKSKYIVTKNIIGSLKVLGIDCVSIASDHIVDFPADVIKNTINILETDEIFVSGRKNMPVYFQKGDKKIAIISTNAVINGTSSLYDKNNISVYSKDNLIKNIEEAKKSAEFVIVDVHWGKEYEYTVTDQMNEIAKAAIDNGANLVIGSHALGVYPMVEYKGVPIIYSLGYFMGDSDLFLGRDSFIFNIDISEENKITEIDMIPIYIYNKKEVMLYNEYNNEKSTEILEQYNKWNKENGLNSCIDNQMIKIKF